MEEEQTVARSQNAEETAEETKGERFKQGDSDSGLRRSRRLAQQPRRNYADMALGNAADSDGENFMASAFSTESEEAFCMMGIAGEISTGPGEPSSVKEALESNDAKRWKESMAEELDGLWDKGTFAEQSAPKGVVPVKTRFVFKIKRASDGSVERYKSRLVAKGFTQRSGVDFFETFSPVVGFDTMRTVLAASAAKGWNIKVLDFKQAYLNAPLREDIWLELPNGEVVKACKAVYGLRQSAMEWWKELRKSIVEAGWVSSAHDECLYYRRGGDGRIAVLTTYVDDLLLTGDDEAEIGRMVEHLLAKYEGRDLGVPEKLVGVNIKVTERGISLDRSMYTEGIVTEGMGSTDVRKVYTPLDPGIDLSARNDAEDELDVSRFPYARILGKLMFLAGMTRPDISCSVRELSRRTASPCMRHWRGLQHLLRYLAGTIDVGIHYRRNDTNSRGDKSTLVGYSDADWGADLESRRSVTGYLLLVNGSPVGWKSKLQQSVSLSTLESEWTAMVAGIRHGLFLNGILIELGFPEARMPWFCDNRGAIQSASKVGFRGRTRHVDIALKCTREYIENGSVGISYVPSSDQLADVFTKRIRKPLIQKFIDSVLFRKGV